MSQCFLSLQKMSLVTNGYQNSSEYLKILFCVPEKKESRPVLFPRDCEWIMNFHFWVNCTKAFLSILHLDTAKYSAVFNILIFWQI